MHDEHIQQQGLSAKNDRSLPDYRDALRFSIQVKEGALRELLGQLRTHPLMFLPVLEYDVAVAYLSGFDAATEGGALTGFREWLVTRLQGGNNLHWSGLVLGLMGQGPVLVQRMEPAVEKARVEFLFETLEAFFQARASPGGLRAIYVQYDAWLRSQSWYRPSTPEGGTRLSKRPRKRKKASTAPQRRR